jgi:hypothetical protein
VEKEGGYRIIRMGYRPREGIKDCGEAVRTMGRECERARTLGEKEGMWKRGECTGIERWSKDFEKGVRTVVR